MVNRIDEIYVVAAKRTAIGKLLGGSLKEFTAAELGGFAIRRQWNKLI